MKPKKLIAIVICLAVLVSLTACSMTDYKTAAGLAENGDWAGAREIFAALGDYKDAAEKVRECDYEIAGGLLADGACEDARALYESLGDYLDSADKISECDYEIAGNLLADGKYDDAIALYESLGDYGDAAEQIEECKYRKALALLETEAYEEAEALFTELEDYRDSADMVSACRYRHAVSLYDAGSYEEALNLFMTLPGYEQSDRYTVLSYLQYDQSAFVDLFVSGMNVFYEAGGFGMKMEEVGTPKHDERSFHADWIPNYHEVILAFNCDDADGKSHSDGQINNILLIGDTYDVNDVGTIYQEFLLSSAFATFVLDDNAMLESEAVTQMIDESMTRTVADFNGEDDYTAQDHFEYDGYQCETAVIFWPGDDGIYRFMYSITIPELIP